MDRHEVCEIELSGSITLYHLKELGLRMSPRGPSATLYKYVVVRWERQRGGAAWAS